MHLPGWSYESARCIAGDRRREVYLIKLLEAEEIPFHMVGTHRRIRFEDLRDYKLRDDLTRRRAADDLARLSQELGLY